MKLPPTRGVTPPPAAPAEITGFADWSTAVATLLIAAVVVGVLLATAATHGAEPSSGVATASRSAEKPDVLSSLPFNCLGSAALAVGPVPALAYVDGVRSVAGRGYDRVTIWFRGGRPAEAALSTQSSATFKSGTGGQTVALTGQAGALLTLQQTDGHTDYRGPTDIKTGNPIVRELRQVLDSGSVVQWAIGLSASPCYRMAFLDDPAGLAIDFGPRLTAQ